MTIERTKQQTACDGVRTAWQTDAFTQILQHQVTKKFPMDGVIRVEAPIETPAVVRDLQKENMHSKIESIQKVEKNFIGAMDGIRRQWKPVPAV